MKHGGRRHWRGRSFGWAAAVVFFIAVLVFVAALRSPRTMKTAAQFEIKAEQYSAPEIQLDPVRVSRWSSPLLVTYDAPVDQSWVFLECELIDANDQTGATFFIQLEYYYGVSDGQPWEKGAGRGSKLVELTGKGPYRLRVKGAGGYGDTPPSEALPDAGPPVRLQFLTGVPRTHTLTWASVLLALVGFALLLRALAASPSSPPVSSRSQKMGSKPRFLFLDGLRGVAVLAVLCCHFLVPEISLIADPLQQALGAPLSAVIRHGDLGVEIFFVLSGFVISYTVVEQRVSSAFTGRFIARRAVRLDPPYYVALLIMLTVVAMEHADGLTGAWRQFEGWDTAIINMFYLQDLLHHPTPLDISWSLCLEIQFYLAFILICAVAQRLGRAGGIQSPDHSPYKWHLALVMPLMAISLYCWYPDSNRFDFFGTWFRFGLGILTCWTFMKRISPLWLYGTLAAITIPAVVAHDLRGLAVVATAVSIHLAGRSGSLTTRLSGRVIQFFGRISYSMYLIHLAAGIFMVNLIWKFVEPTPINALLLVPAGFAGAILGAWALYVLFERPSVSLSQRIRKQSPTKEGVAS